MKQVLENFNVMVRDSSGDLDTSMISHGVISDFVLTKDDKKIIAEVFPKLHMRTLFSRKEYQNSTPEELMMKQFLNYIETYGIGAPGLFNLEHDGDDVIVARIIRGITKEKLVELVKARLAENAPIKDTQAFEDIVKHYDIRINPSKISNNEMRVRLYSKNSYAFDNGDDAVRYMVYKMTGNSLLIKNEETIKAMEGFQDAEFLSRHTYALAGVFNRHKKLIMAAKNKKTASAINLISKRSKQWHVPLEESFNKYFIATALKNPSEDYSRQLDKMSVRDKFKFLNILTYKKQQSPNDVFIIRNGKAHFAQDRPIYLKGDIEKVEKQVLKSLKKDVKHLKGKTIVLDENIQLGLPISEKQSLGKLPFGTRVTSEGKNISSGIYWENGWGAKDLDLSTIDLNGNRVGWGNYYNNKDIKYSGDMTYAEPCAMEFMTSSTQTYGLMVNVYNGQVPCSMHVTVGRSSKKSNTWAKDAYISEKLTINRRQSCIGFVVDKTFIVYPCNLNNSHVSGGKHPIVEKALADMWTVKKLFDHFGISYQFSATDKTDIDLRYRSLSWEKLSTIFDKE